MKRVRLNKGAIICFALLFFSLISILSVLYYMPSSSSGGVASAFVGGEAVYLPIALKDGPTMTPIPSPTMVSCDIPGASFERIPIKGAPDKKRDDVDHADLNLAVRGYDEVDEFKGLIHYGGPTDSQAPQLAGLFADERTPNIVETYAVYDWDWGTGTPNGLIPTWPVTLVGIETTQGELLYLPDRQGGDIFQGRFKAVVIYAEHNFITLKYTREDDVVQGYTIHVANLCVEPDLVALYRQGDDEGRRELPALANGQPFGIAISNEIQVAIRDVGSFMDPRSRKDWWVGHPLTIPTITPTPDATSTPSATLTPDITSTPSATLTPDATSTPSATLTPDATSIPSATLTPDVTSTPTLSVTLTSTITPTIDVAQGPSATPTLTITPAIIRR